MRKNTTKPQARGAGHAHSPAGFQSVVAAVDLTAGSDRVLGRLARLPLVDGTRVTLLHVVPGSLSPAEQRSAERDASTALVEEVQHLRERVKARVGIEALVRVGPAARTIAACAREVRADLIVMGRGGGRALRDALLGSTAERVIRQARMPVLVVRLAPRRVYARPVLALDLDPTAHDVVRLMLLFVPPAGARVEVIHAVQPRYHHMVYPSLPLGEEDEWQDAQCSKASAELSALLASALAKSDIPRERWPYWTPHVRYGTPRQVVEKAAQRAQADLLVLGTHGYSGAAFVFLGTVAGDLLRSAKCDVLIVPSKLSQAATRRE